MEATSSRSTPSLSVDGPRARYFRFNTFRFLPSYRFFYGFAFYLNRYGIQNNDIRNSIDLQDTLIHVTQRLLHFKNTVYNNSGIQYFILFVSQIFF